MEALQSGVDMLKTISSMHVCWLEPTNMVTLSENDSASQVHLYILRNRVRNAHRSLNNSPRTLFSIG